MISQTNQPVNWRCIVETTAKPISQIARSSANTTFTKKRVTDGSVWDLSKVKVGNVVEVVDAVSGETYMGRVAEIDNANNYIELQGPSGWFRGDVHGRALAAMTPSDGSVAIIHSIDKCVYLLMDALIANTDEVYYGDDGTVTVEGGANPGHPISEDPSQVNFRFELEAAIDEHTRKRGRLNLTGMYVIAASTQELSCVAM